jgi:hypothetical protein
MNLGAFVHRSATAELAPAIGWRIWRLLAGNGEVRLGSVVYPAAWQPGEPLRAECEKLPRRSHDAPDGRCECGIYAARELTPWAHYLRVGGDRVFGRVLLWGDVVEARGGWRGARAAPVELYVPARLDEAEAVADALAAYRVPVHLVDDARPHVGALARVPVAA